MDRFGVVPGLPSDASNPSPWPPGELPRLLFVIHPGAGGRHGRARLQRLLERSPGIRRRAEIAVVRSLEETCEILTRRGAEVVPVAAGGDGTANLVARAVRQARPQAAVMGVLPLGTGNAFAHAVGVGDLGRAGTALNTPRVRALDVMRTTHPAAPLALVSLSVGFEAAFLHDYARWRRYSRAGAGAAALLHSCTSFREDVAVTLDGAVFVPAGGRVYNVGLYNLPCYAAGRIMWPDADGADGEAEAVAARSAGAYWKLFRGGLRTAHPLDDGDPLARRWRSAQVRTSGPVQVDGETVPGGSFEVRVEAGGLRVLVGS